jgi:putative two-component system response regulator
MKEMQRHPILGFETIARAQAQVGVESAHDEAILQIAKDIVYTHHERWDGQGYPRGLACDAIPVAGRIVAVVDAYDAMVEPRAYRESRPHDGAVAIIVEGRGTQFDPDVVDAFLAVEREFRLLRSRMQAQHAEEHDATGAS